MSQIYLYNSTICRLCGERSQNGIKLFTSDERDVSQLINRYLPLKIADDRQYPRWLCPGCHLQVESTVEFFDLVMRGQENLRCKLDEQLKANSDHSKKNNLFVEDHVIHSRFGQQGTEKRRRGRPSKATVDKLKEQEQQAAEAARIEQLAKAEKESQELLEEIAAGGRRKRKIKLPSRFQEVVQGRELERVYVANGVIDKLENVSDNECFTNEAEVNDYSEGVIGHMEDTDGSHVVDLVFDSSKMGKKHAHSIQRKKFICEICSRSYTQQLRYMSHKMTHHNVQYECIQCLEKFSSRKLISEHQVATKHTGEGIIENIEDESNDGGNLMPETIAEGAHDDANGKPVEALDDVFDEMDNIEETAAKVLYGLQNMDRTESPQSFSVSIGAKEMNSEFLNFTNFVTGKRDADNKVDDKTLKKPLVQEIDSQKTTNIESTSYKIKAKRHDCSICNKTFANESLLSVHFQLIHELTLTNDTADGTNNSTDPTKYPCDKCKRMFKNPSSVLYHKNSEHNHFRFVCSKCGKSFKHKQLLRRHQLVHSQDRKI